MINLKIEIGDSVFIGSEFRTIGGFIYISGMNVDTKYVAFIDRELMEKVGAWNIPNGAFLIYANISVNPNNLPTVLDKNISDIEEIWIAINNIISRLNTLEE
jgi:hypothetical protein